MRTASLVWDCSIFMLDSRKARWTWFNTEEAYKKNGYTYYHTLDGSEILHQLRLLVYLPLFTRFSTCRAVRGISSINSISIVLIWEKLLHHLSRLPNLLKQPAFHGSLPLAHLGFFNSAINPPTSSSPNKRISFVKKSIQKMHGNRIPTKTPFTKFSSSNLYRLLQVFFVRGVRSFERSRKLDDFLEDKKKNAVTSDISVSWLRRGAPNSPASKALPNRDLSGFFSPRVEANKCSKNPMPFSIILEVFI